MALFRIPPPRPWALAALSILVLGCSDDSPPVFLETHVAGNTADPQGPYEVMALVKDDGAVRDVTLHLALNPDAQTPFESYPMEPVGPDSWSGPISGQPIGTTVSYYLSARDEAGNEALSPERAPAAIYSFTILGLECSTLADCPSGQICRAGHCVPACISDMECAQGQICQSGRCVGGCRADSDCPDGHICHLATCLPACQDDADCPEGQTCLNGACIPGCLDDSDCPQGQICVAGSCAPGCWTNDQCPLGSVCRAGVCVEVCLSDDQCAPGWICEDGSCLEGCRDDDDCPPGQECWAGTCVDLSTCEDDPYEDNDSSDEAPPLVEDQSLVLCPNDDDWFTLTVAPRSLVEVELQFPAGDVELGVYTAAGALMASASPEGDILRARFSSDEGGSYLVWIRSQALERITYSLAVEVTVMGEGELCDGCWADEECGEGEDLCVEVIPGGERFCGISCMVDGLCPEGYFCHDPAVVVEGHEIRGDFQCVPLRFTCRPPCQGDEDCPEGERCVEGVCEPGCRDDLGCPPGQMCVDGVCRPECESDEECPAGQICEHGECIPGCRDDGACPFGYICEANLCVPGCRDETDCPLGQVCIDGRCQAPVCQDDIHEENDFLSQAAILAPGPAHDLAICRDDDDWFAIDLGYRDRLTVTLAAQGSGELTMDLYGASLGELLDQADEEGPLKQVSLAHAAQAGLVHLLIRGADRAEGGYSLLVEVEAGGLGGGFCDPCTDDVDCGGEEDACVALLEGKRCGLACPEGVCPAEAVCVEMPPLVNQCIPMTYQCEASWPCGGDDDCPPGWTCEDHTCHPPPCQDDQYEPNNTSLMPTAVDRAGTLGDLMLCRGDQDWFAFTVEPRQTLIVRVDFLHAQGDLDLEVYRGDEALACESATDGDVELCVLESSLEGTTFNIKISSPRGAETSYSLTLSLIEGGGLCGPCGADEECGGGSDLCLMVGEGLYCGRDCADEACPGGFVCDDSLAVPQCRPEAGVCPGPCATDWDCPPGSFCQEGLCLPIPCLDDGQEPDDAPDEATAVADGFSHTGVLCPQDEDWFGASLQQGDGIEVIIQYDPALGDLGVELLDGAMVPVGTVVASPGQVRASLVDGPATDIFVRLYGAAVVIPYGLQVTVIINHPCLDDAMEPNSEQSPSLIEEGTYPGLTICRGDHDWYGLLLSAGDTITSLTIYFSGATANLDLELMNSRGEIIASSVTVDQDSERVEAVRLPVSDLYLAHVWSPEGGENSYQMVVDIGGGLCTPCDGDFDCGTANDYCLLGSWPTGGYCLQDCTNNPCPRGYQCSCYGGICQCFPNDYSCE